MFDCVSRKKLRQSVLTVAKVGNLLLYSLAHILSNKYTVL